MARVCVDACFLIGLYDEDDQYHAVAERQFQALFGEDSGRHQMVVAWPALYESLGTRLARSRKKSRMVTQMWTSLRQSQLLIVLDDRPYRENCLKDHMDGEVRALSLVDRVLRAMILDRRKAFDYFLTYNAGDFADACREVRIPLIDQAVSPGFYGI